MIILCFLHDLYYFNQIIYSHIASLLPAPSTVQEYLLGMFSHYYGYKGELMLMYKAKVTHIILETLNETFSAIRADETRENRYATHYHTGGIYNTFFAVV